MKKFLTLILIMICLLCSGCKKDFAGTWCLYTETPSSLILLDNNINDNDLNNIKAYIESISNLKTYDVINNIEDANNMITIYYTSKDNISTYQDKIMIMNGVLSVKENDLNTPVEELTISSDNYTYGTKLDTIDASKKEGTYTINGNNLILDNNKSFYYKNKFLCYDKDCNTLMTKSSSNTCND
jgi:hypothetical protein